MADQEQLNLEIPVEEKPKRRGRPRKVQSPEAESIEAEQARILAEAMAAAGQAPAAEEAPKKRRGRPRKVKPEEAAATESAASEAAAAETPAPEKPKRGRPRKVKPAEDAATQAAEAEASEEKPAEPKRKRGRPRKVQPVEAVETAEAPQAQPDNAEAAEEKPARKTRTRRTAKKAEDAEATDSAADSSKSEAKAEKNEGESSDKASKETADQASNDDNNNEGGNNRQHRNGNDRRQRNRDRKNRNNRNNVQNEPSLSREELAAMKIVELRTKAKGLDIDPAGIKKPELVELVYTAAAKAEGFRDIAGILDIDNQGFGFIRAHGYMPSKDDAFVSAQMIRAARLRAGDFIEGTLRPGRPNDKYPGLSKIKSINGVDPEAARTRPRFGELTPIYPNEPLKMEHGKDSITGRAIDIVSPIGKGQRGLIVSPPKAGKTTILKKICQSIAVNNPEVYLICLLVDERPEEVTDMQRSIKGDVVASTFDMPADNHTRVSELVMERAKRIVEMGGDVVIVLDSITRLARAYNLAAPASGRILSGGVDSASLYPPKKFLGAARNIENGGSLTILASALIDTGSKMDEVIFEEFKGTGNMELKLDRDLADRRIFPAIDPVASGTRNENLLIDPNMQAFYWGIRRILANMNNTERSAASFIKGLKATDSNQEFLIRSAKKAAEHPDAL